MNVFAWHPDPTLAARGLPNQHVNKMILESAQILCTALHLKGVTAVESQFWYKPTHKHHPCTKKAVEDPAYFEWILCHGMALADEYANRSGNGNTHKTFRVLKKISEVRHEVVPLVPPFVKDWPTAMPDHYRGPDPHAAYTRYLRAKYIEWTRRPRKAMTPRWPLGHSWGPFAPHPLLSESLRVLSEPQFLEAISNKHPVPFLWDLPKNVEEKGLESLDWQVILPSPTYSMMVRSRLRTFLTESEEGLDMQVKGNTVSLVSVS